jgi:hypothetical protein
MTLCIDNPMNRKWFLSSSEERVCPGHCDPAYALDSDGHWRCGCGSWTPVDTPPVLLFPELAAYDGQRLWGDVWLDEQEAELARMDAHQRRMHDLLEGAKAREAATAMARAAAEAEIVQAATIVCNRQGVLLKKVLRKCRDAEKAAVVIGTKGLVKREFPNVEATLAAGFSVHRVWNAGCELHAKGCCQYIHPDQAEWAQFTAGARPISRDGERDFSALRGKQQRF